MVLDELVTLLGLQVDGAAFARGEAALAGLKKGAIAIGAAALAGAAALGAMVEGTVNAGVAASRGAKMVGMTAEAFQELGYAAQASGLSTETFQQGMGFLARNMAAAQRGSKEAAEAFGAVGVTITDVHGKLRPTEDMLEDLADHFSSLPDDTEKTAQAMQIFGRAGKQLIPFLDKGRDGIAALREEAEKLGVVLDDDAIEKTKAFHEAQVRLNASLVGLRNAIALPLLDAIRPLLESFTKWVAVNRVLIAQKIHVVVGAIAAAFKVIGIIVGKFLGLIRPLLQNTTFLKIALIALGVVLAVLAGEFIIAGAAAVGAALASAAAWLLATAPIALLVVLLGLVVLVAEDIYQALTGGKSLIADIWAQWDKVLESWTLGNGKDGWLITDIKAAIGYLTHLSALWEAFKIAIGLEEVKTLEGVSGNKQGYINAKGELAPESEVTQDYIGGPKRNAAGEEVRWGTAGDFTGNRDEYHARIAAMNEANANAAAQRNADLAAKQPGGGGLFQSSYGNAQLTAPVTVNIYAGPGDDVDVLAQKAGGIINDHTDEVMRRAKDGN